jgi:hypothetical protein
MTIGEVRQITTAGRWQGQTLACHLATMIWLYEKEFQRTPTLQQYQKFAPDFAQIMKQIAGFGQKLQRPLAGQTQLTKGSVLLFVGDGGVEHSCMAISSTRIGGYNQNSWFQKSGVLSEYSTHDTSEIKWGDKSRPFQAAGNKNGAWYTLLTVPEAMARAVIRQHAQG